MKKLLFIITLLLIPSTVVAAGLEVTPAKLELRASPKESATKSITISNPTADVLLFDVFPDDFADIISVSPKSFTLESGAKQTVKVLIAPPRSNRIITTNLSILAKPLSDSKFQTNAGVKIPISVTVAASRTVSVYFWIIVAAAAIITAETALYIISKRRKKL